MEYESLFEFLDSISAHYLLNEPLYNHTSFKIGGNADVFVQIRNQDELAKICAFCYNKYKFIAIGNGSNLLFNDNGFKGVVLHISSLFSNVELIGDNTLVCNAGASLSSICNFALSNGLGGLEFAFGIPGTLGGAVYMNAGAYGGEMCDIVSEVSFVTLDGKKGVLARNELGFGYRNSVFTSGDKIITSATIQLHKKDKEEIKSLMKENMLKRKTKQPLEFPSAGSTFKRPQGHFAGALIEQSGLKGYTIGGAQVSQKHAGFIINIGDATCSDVTRLIDYIKKTVLQKFGVELVPEVKIIE